MVYFMAFGLIDLAVIAALLWGARRSGRKHAGIVALAVALPPIVSLVWGVVFAVDPGPIPVVRSWWITRVPEWLFYLDAALAIFAVAWLRGARLTVGAASLFQVVAGYAWWAIAVMQVTGNWI